MPPKLPFMPFYGVDFYDDEKVRLMDLEEEAVYMRLLWMQWREGSLPQQPAELARLARVEGITARVMACFPPAHGRRKNPRLERIRVEQSQTRERLSEAGKRGRAKQLLPELGPGLAQAEHAQPVLGYSESDTDKETTNSVAPHGANGAKGKHSKHPTWLTPIGMPWQDRVGTPPYGQMAAELKSLVDKNGEAEVLKRWTHYLDGTDPKYWSPRRFAATYKTWEQAPAVTGLADETQEYV
jgi:hypothetical protein